MIADNSNDGLGLFPDVDNIAIAYVSDTVFENDFRPVTNSGGTVFTFGNNEFVNSTFPPDAMSLVSVK